MHTKHAYRLVLLTTLLLAGSPAWAHVSYQHTGLWAGLAHPFSGLDHLLAAFGIGAWAWSRKITVDKYKVFAPGAAYLGMVLFSLMFAVSWLPAASLEWLLAGSVLMIGLLVLTAARLPFRSGALFAGFFVACHGYAHIVEMPEALLESVYATAAYTAGFAAATLALFAGGMIAARLLEKLLSGRTAPLIGGGLTTCGLYLLAAV